MTRPRPLTCGAVPGWYRHEDGWTARGGLASCAFVADTMPSREHFLEECREDGMVLEQTANIVADMVWPPEPLPTNDRVRSWERRSGGWLSDVCAEGLSGFWVRDGETRDQFLARRREDWREADHRPFYEEIADLVWP